MLFRSMKTGTHPMQSRLRLFLDWGITFDKTYETEQRANRKVHYADKTELEQNIIETFGNIKSYSQTPPAESRKPTDSMDYSPTIQQDKKNGRNKGGINYSADKVNQKMSNEERK